MTLRYRLLALDIDGTLVNSRHELSDRVREAVWQARDAGIRIVLATGRRYSRVLPLVEPLRLEVPLITASGALIKRPLDHQTLFRASFPPQVLTELLSIVVAGGYEPILYADTFAEGFDYYCRRTEVEQPELAEFLALNTGFERLWPELATRPPAGIFAGFAMGSREQMLALESQLIARLGDRLYVHVLKSPRYAGSMCEIAPYGVSKWFGVCHLADQWGIPAEAICAVGDDVNDIPMILGAGLGVAMANAGPHVQEVADRIAPTNDEDGIVEVIRWLLADN